MIIKEIKTTKITLERAEKLGVQVVKSLRVEGKRTDREILCSNCNSQYVVQDQTFTRWAKEGKLFCGYCNGSNKALPPELKVRQLNDRLPSIYKKYFKVVEYLGYNKEKEQAYCLVKFSECSHTKKYSTTVLGHLTKAGKALRCDACYTGKEQESRAESIVRDALPEHFLHQVPYSSISSCDRKWVADFFSIRYNTIIEVSSGSTRLREDYSSNLVAKKEWAAVNGVSFVVTHSLNDLEDIVQSLGN